MLHAYTRPDEKASWTEFAPAQAAPKSMPRVVKVGFKLSAEAHRSAQVRWVDLTLNGQIVRRSKAAIHLLRNERRDFARDRGASRRGGGATASSRATFWRRTRRRSP